MSEPRDPEPHDLGDPPDDAIDAATPDAATCAVCGSTNDCGIARGDTTCWCFDLVVPKSLLAQIPEPLRDRACVCRACVERESRGLPVVGS